MPLSSFGSKEGKTHLLSPCESCSASCGSSNDSLSIMNCGGEWERVRNSGKGSQRVAPKSRACTGSLGLAVTRAPITSARSSLALCLSRYAMSAAAKSVERGEENENRRARARRVCRHVIASMIPLACHASGAGGVFSLTVKQTADLIKSESSTRCARMPQLPRCVLPPEIRFGRTQRMNATPRFAATPATPATRPTADHRSARPPGLRRASQTQRFISSCVSARGCS